MAKQVKAEWAAEEEVGEGPGPQGEGAEEEEASTCLWSLSPHEGLS